MKRFFVAALFVPTFAGVVTVQSATAVAAKRLEAPVISALPKTESVNFRSGLAVKSDGTVAYVESGVGIMKVSSAGAVSAIVSGKPLERSYTSAFVAGGGVFAASNSGVFSSPIGDGYIVYNEKNGAGVATEVKANNDIPLNSESQDPDAMGIMSTASGNVYASKLSQTETQCTATLYKLGVGNTFSAVRSLTQDKLFIPGDPNEPWSSYYSSENCIDDRGVVDDSGNVYFAPWQAEGQKIFKWSATNQVSVVAGTGVAGDGRHGDNGPATAANLGEVLYPTVDTKGNLYFYERGYVRRISPSGTLTTVAGAVADWQNGTRYNYSGDGREALGAELGRVDGLKAAPSGDLYLSTRKIVNEEWRYIIRRIDMNQVLSAGAGTPLAITKRPALSHSSDVEISVRGSKVTVGLTTPVKAKGTAGTKKEIVSYTVTLKPSKKSIASVTKQVKTSSGASVQTVLTGKKKSTYTIVVTAIARSGSKFTWTGPKVTL